MKINETHRQVLQETQKGPQKSGANGASFQQVMDEMRRQADEKGEVGRTGGIEYPAGGVHLLSRTLEIPGAQSGEEEREVVAALQQSLDLLDFYGTRLGDDSLSMGGMGPLIEHLEERMEHLQAMGSKPGLPDKLKPILSDVVVTIGTEVARFKRGDYD